jgi:hypothetical protein
VEETKPFFEVIRKYDRLNIMGRQHLQRTFPHEWRAACPEEEPDRPQATKFAPSVPASGPVGLLGGHVRRHARSFVKADKLRPSGELFVMFGFDDGFRIRGVHVSQIGLHGGPAGSND